MPFWDPALLVLLVVEIWWARNICVVTKFNVIIVYQLDVVVYNCSNNRDT